MTDVRAVVVEELQNSLREKDVEPPAAFKDDMPVLDTGLDSIDYAILVARLEERFGKDPFLAMAEPVYPETVGQFIQVYEDHVG